MYGGPNYAYAAPQGPSYGAQPQQPQYVYEGSALAPRKPPRSTRKRLNLFAISISLFLPWLLFCLIYAMLSFALHYSRPHICEAIAAIVGVVIGLMLAIQLLGVVRRTAGGEASGEASSDAPSWVLFFWISMLLALLLAVYFGNRNFWSNMQPYHDLRSLNTYDNIDPALHRGQEFMDAAEVIFHEGVALDLRKAVSFQNGETYCVAPISSGVAPNVPLNNYDFWAVGKNCCSGSNDFHCGDMQRTTHGGVRVVRDDERSFYRLAVQQAESAYAIKAVHPLFFHWVSDPTDHVDSLRRQGYRAYLIGLLAYFGFQFVLVVANIFLIKEGVHS